MSNIFNALQFDDINSLDYGIYITGAGVFNAPKREVEAVSIPGRNGSVLIDKGNYQNIEVTYKAGVFGKDKSEFASKIRAFRNALASKTGYRRIVDTYNPDEYRMGSFVSPIDTVPVACNRAGEFDIVFNCKPQRFLMSGEAEIELVDGQVLYNPTPHSSKPLLVADGYGAIDINDYHMEIINGLIGEIVLAEKSRLIDILPYEISFSRAPFNTGDTLTLQVVVNLELNNVLPNERISGANAEIDTYTGIEPEILQMIDGSNNYVQAEIKYDATFEIGTDDYNSTFIDEVISFTNHEDVSATIAIILSYNSDADLIFIGAYLYNIGQGIGSTKITMNHSALIGDSSKSVLGSQTYIDCEIGEAYMVEDESIISLNKYVNIGADLPELSPGNNDISYDDTNITSLKIVPRWWVL